MAEENLGEIFVKIKADVSDLEKDVRAIKAKLDKEIPTAKINFDTSLGKLKIAELEKYYYKLKAVYDKKIQLNADIESIRRTRSQLKNVESILNDVKRKAEDGGDKLSRWSQITTGINQGFELVRNTFAGLTNLIGGSVTASNSLEVLKANFVGTSEDLELFRKGTAGTVGDANLIKLSNQATDLGISLKQQAILFSLSEDAADKYGTNVEDGMMRVIAASEGSTRALKSLGIQKEVYESIVVDMAKAQGTTIDKLDAETQKQIRLEAIIKASGLTLDDVKNKVKDNADKYESLSVRVEQAKVDLGKLISDGLMPLINGLDKSGNGVKKFISYIMGIGGVVLQAIPLIVQLYSAKKILASASLFSATALGTETAAINANTTAKVANSKVTLGLIGKVGAIAAVGVAIWQLTEYINENTKAIKKNREEADKKYPDWDKSGFGPRNIADQTNQKMGDQGLSWIKKHLESTQKTIDELNKSNEKASLSVDDIRKRIEELTKANDAANISWKDYYKNLQEIDNLQKRLNLPKEQSPYTKPNEVNVKGLQKIPESEKKLKGIETPENPYKTDQRTQDLSSLIKGYEEAATPTWADAIVTAADMAQGAVDGLFEDISVKGEWANSVFEKAFAGMADAVIANIQRMISQWLSWQAIRGLASLIPGVGTIVNAATAATGATGGTFIGTSTGVKKLASGGSFIVPTGFSHDNYPMFVQTGEKVKVTPANKVGEEERLLSTLIKRMDVMNYNMIESMMQKTQRLAIDLYGEIDNNSIRLANKRANKKYSRLT
jgi:hypothetical protein